MYPVLKPLPKLVDQKLVACLSNLNFQPTDGVHLYDKTQLIMAIGMGHAKALEVLLREWRPWLSDNSPGWFFMFVALVQDPGLRRELLQVLTRADKEGSRQTALARAAGQLNDMESVVWLLDFAAPWSKEKLVESGITAAVKWGNEEVLHLLLERWVRKALEYLSLSVHV